MRASISLLPAGGACKGPRCMRAVTCGSLQMPVYIYLSASITVTVTLNIWLGVGRVHAGHWLVPCS